MDILNSEHVLGEFVCDTGPVIPENCSNIDWFYLHKVLYNWPLFDLFTHSYTDDGGAGLTHQEQLRAQRVTQGHFDMWSQEELGIEPLALWLVENSLYCLINSC